MLQIVFIIIISITDTNNLVAEVISQSFTCWHSFLAEFYAIYWPNDCANRI